MMIFSPSLPAPLIKKWCQHPGDVGCKTGVQCYVVCVCHLLDLSETPLLKFPKVWFDVGQRSLGFLRSFLLFLISFRLSDAAATPKQEH